MLSCALNNSNTFNTATIATLPWSLPCYYGTVSECSYRSQHNSHGYHSWARLFLWPSFNLWTFLYIYWRFVDYQNQFQPCWEDENTIQEYERMQVKDIFKGTWTTSTPLLSIPNRPDHDKNKCFLIGVLKLNEGLRWHDIYWCREREFVIAVVWWDDYLYMMGWRSPSLGMKCVLNTPLKTLPRPCKDHHVLTDFFTS